MAIDITEINALVLADFGEPVTLIPGDTNEVLYQEKAIVALYTIQRDHLLPLDGSRESETWTAVCAESDLEGADTWCQLRARGKLHNILSAMPDGAGFINILLSEPWVEA
jgi:hypothetical protein